MMASSQSYHDAREKYGAYGVETEQALEILGQTAISLHCWQGDDVRGFEGSEEALGGGLAVTGRHPGQARTPDELRAHLEKALSLLPGRHRLNLHASYADLGGKKVERTEYRIEHFQGWLDWCRERQLGFDFNPTFFSHPLAADGFTLAHAKEEVRRYWIEHGKACRRIAAEASLQLSGKVVTNFWIPDGYKDLPADRKAPRERLAAALDEIFSAPTAPESQAVDAVESKLFGLGSECYVVGSYDYYLGYAVSRQKLLCLDAGHFHPTETLADKISAVLQFVPGILLHLSRGVRWDSDHVVLLDDATRAVLEEVVAGEYLDRVQIGLDYFDASIDRIAAWVIGARSARKALLQALLLPHSALRDAECAGDFTRRLALMEEMKTMPLGAVWEEFCQREEKPAAMTWARAGWR